MIQSVPWLFVYMSWLIVCVSHTNDEANAVVDEVWSNAPEIDDMLWLIARVPCLLVCVPWLIVCGMCLIARVYHNSLHVVTADGEANVMVDAVWRNAPEIDDILLKAGDFIGDWALLGHNAWYLCIYVCFICGTWLIWRVCIFVYIYVCFICGTSLILRIFVYICVCFTGGTLLIFHVCIFVCFHVCAMTRTYVAHDSFVWKRVISSEIGHFWGAMRGTYVYRYVYMWERTYFFGVHICVYSCLGHSSFTFGMWTIYIKEGGFIGDRALLGHNMWYLSI